MKEIGFPISSKENENRRAILPADISKLKHPGNCFFETGFGAPFELSDRDLEQAGAHAVSRDDALAKEVICNPKALDEDMIAYLKPGQTLFGWIHAVQGKNITDTIVDHGMTAIAWEDMYEGDRHVFWRNNEIAGEAAILHAAHHAGKLPDEWKVALLGKGNVGKGAFAMLERLGADIEYYALERIFDLAEQVGSYDVIVNTLLWDVFESRLIMSREDLKRMKTGSMIIDISCDSEGMAIESTRSTTISDPVYILEGVVHYVVDHTPALFYRSATEAISIEVSKYLDDIIEGNSNPVLEKATIIRDGKILDERIMKFQNRQG